VKAHTLVTTAAIVALVAPAAATAKTIPARGPAAHVKVTKTNPAKRLVPHVTKQGAAPRQLCICVSSQIDRAKVQAQADFEAAFNYRMLARGLESWEWPNDSSAVAAFDAGMAALLAGTKTIDQIFAEVDAAW
jgi:hypothetical protein